VYERLDAIRVEPFGFLVAIIRKRGFLVEMTVTVLLFASYAEKLGKSSIPLELAHGATVGDVLTSLQRLPGASRLPTEPLVAVNERYARRDHVLASGDEVAIIPPVAGG
jgi:molybdopterin converting factor subunit 1